MDEICITYMKNDDYTINNSDSAQVFAHPVIFLLAWVLAHRDSSMDLSLIYKVAVLRDSLHCTTNHKRIPSD